MRQIVKYSPSTQQLYTPLPDDCIDLTPDTARQVMTALNQGLPFVFNEDGVIHVAPSARHRWYADKDRWIDYSYQYSSSADICYPSDMLDQYADKPDDLQPITDAVYNSIMEARAKGLKYVVITDGESLSVAPSVAHDWDSKKSEWVLNEAKQAAIDAQKTAAQFQNARTEKLLEMNTAAQSFIDQMTGANDTPEYERATWAAQGAEAKAWHADNTAATPTLDNIAKNRGVPAELLRQKAYEKTIAYEVFVSTIAGQRQRFEDQLNAAKTLADVDAIVVNFQVKP